MTGRKWHLGRVGSDARGRTGMREGEHEACLIIQKPLFFCCTVLLGVAFIEESCTVPARRISRLVSSRLVSTNSQHLHMILS